MRRIKLFSILIFIVFFISTAFAGEDTKPPVPREEQAKEQPKEDLQEGQYYNKEKEGEVGFPEEAFQAVSPRNIKSKNPYRGIKPGDTFPENIVTIVPEVATAVEMSNSDVNRFICPATIKDVVFSKEKNIKIKVVGGNVFIKFLLIKKGEREYYSKTPSEIYIVCGDNVYNIIALPKRIPSQTIKPNSEVKAIKKNISLYGGLPLEKKVINILKSVYTGELLDSFAVTQKEQNIDIYKDVKITLLRVIKIEGEGLLVKEFKVEPKAHVEKVTLNEKDFLRTEITTKTVAVMSDKLTLNKGDYARLLVVEGSAQDDR